MQEKKRRTAFPHEPSTNDDNPLSCLFPHGACSGGREGQSGGHFEVCECVWFDVMTSSTPPSFLGAIADTSMWVVWKTSKVEVFAVAYDGVIPVHACLALCEWVFLSVEVTSTMLC